MSPLGHGRLFLLSYLACLPARDIVGAGEACRAHLFADLSCRLHGVQQTHVGVVSEHVIEGVLAIDQLQLVELHVLGSLLQLALLGENLVLELLDEVGILGARRSLLVHRLLLEELLVEVSVLLVHEAACVAKLALQGSDLRHLLLNQLVHLLAQAVLQASVLLGVLPLQSLS